MSTTADEHLRPSQPPSMELWRDVLDSLNNAVIVLSTELEPILLNPAAADLIGASQLTPALLSELFRRNKWLHQMTQVCLDSNKEISRADAMLEIAMRAVGVETEISPLLDRGGTMRGVVIALRDLSYRKNLEHQMAAEGGLSLGLSPAGLAHEIKNPLTGIKGAAELLAAQFPSDQRAMRYCGVIIDGVNRLAGLVEQVLQVSAPGRLKFASLNIHQAIHQAMAMAGLYPSSRHSVSVQQDFDPSLPDISGDSAALERVFLNLIKNALEAVPQQGRIRLHTRMETEFHLSANGRRQRFLRFEIADNGPGLASAEIAQLFTPFFTTKAGGTGLGLVLSQRIVGLHGGRLWAERSEDPAMPGMLFKLILPIDAGL